MATADRSVRLSPTARQRTVPLRASISSTPESSRVAVISTPPVTPYSAPVVICHARRPGTVAAPLSAGGNGSDVVSSESLGGGLEPCPEEPVQADSSTATLMPTAAAAPARLRVTFAIQQPA